MPEPTETNNTIMRYTKPLTPSPIVASSYFLLLERSLQILVCVCEVIQAFIDGRSF